MRPLEDIYKRQFFGRRDSLAWRAEPVCSAIKSVFEPTSVIDVGCAIGDLVKGFLDLGIISYGLEGSERAFEFLMVPEKCVFHEDLRIPITLPFCFDLVLCFEVAEHIEPEYAGQFVSNLTGMSNRILISAASPGQGGHHHVNCQFPGYWDSMFKGFGYEPIHGIAERVKAKLEPWKHKPGIKAYYQNLLYYEGGEPCKST